MAPKGRPTGGGGKGRSLPRSEPSKKAEVTPKTEERPTAGARGTKKAPAQKQVKAKRNKKTTAEDDEESESDEGKDSAKGREKNRTKKKGAAQDAKEAAGKSRSKGKKKGADKEKTRKRHGPSHTGATRDHNPCWNDPNTPARTQPPKPPSIREMREINDRIALYMKDPMPHRLMTYLHFSPNAAERFRICGGPLLERLVNDLYDEEVQRLPHTSREVDIEGHPSADRRRYEESRSTWHALRDRYYHATGWPARRSYGWRVMPARLHLMLENGSRGTTEAQRLSKDRLKLAGADSDAVRQLFQDIFLEIGLRRTRSSLIDVSQAAKFPDTSRSLNPNRVWGYGRQPARKGTPRRRKKFLFVGRKRGKKKDAPEESDTEKESGTDDGNGNTEKQSIKKKPRKSTKKQGSGKKKEEEEKETPPTRRRRERPTRTGTQGTITFIQPGIRRK